MIYVRTEMCMSVSVFLTFFCKSLLRLCAAAQHYAAVQHFPALPAVFSIDELDGYHGVAGNISR